MDQQQFQRVEELFHAALERAPEARQAFLDQACGEDDDLRSQVQVLLTDEEQAGSFLERPLIDEETNTATRMSQMIGRQFGPYRIVSALGSGGMGEVYRAWDSRLDRIVAVKVVKAELAGRADFRHRFQREARALAQLNHPNICTIHDVGPDFLVMEWLQGQTLKEKTSAGPLGLEEALEIVIQAGRGLDAAHERGIHHRDIKPANIMVTPLGQAKLMDFGLVKFRDAASGDTTGTLGPTEAGAAMGTPSYMSPEQVRGGAADERTDIWSLGVVLYETVTGRRPFRGGSGMVVMRSILDDQPEPPSALRKELPAALDQIVAKALAKAPAMRYQHVQDLLADLQIAREGNTSVGGPRSNIPKSKPPMRSSVKVGVATALLMLMALLYSVASRSRLAGPGLPGYIQTLAVLPLANLSGDPSQEFFADGMTDELIANLAQIGSLRVISRTSVMRFKETKELLPEIARRLKADAVVEGTVLRSGNRVRITAELIDATDRHLWAKSYERSVGDVLDLQNEVARAIAAEIQAKLTPREKAQLARSRAVNPDAYEAYLKGRYYNSNLTQDSILRAIEYFEQSIKLDPGYAAAYAGLAICWLRFEYLGAPPEEVHPKALAAATRALQIDDSLAETHTAIAELRSREWNWDTSDSEIKIALDLDPSLTTAFTLRSDNLRHLGRTTESIADAKEAVRLDPLFPGAIESLGDAYKTARQYDLAIEQYQKALELNANQAASRNSLGWCYVYKGLFDQGVREIQESYGEDPELSPELAYIYAMRGNKLKAREILDHLLNLSRQNAFAAHHFALIYTGLGDTEQAIAWLEKAYQQHSPMMPWLKTDPRFDGLRSDRRFQELMGRVGLL